MKKSAVAGFILIGMVFAAGEVRAEEQDVVYEKHTVVDFGDDTIEGDLTRPDSAVVESRKRLKHANLIRIRKHFRTEILRTARGL